MRKLFACLVLCFCGCRTAPQVTTEKIQPPTPRETPALARQSLRVKSLSVPDRYILIRWDASAETNVTYQIQWSPQGSPETVYAAPVATEQQDVVSLFKSRHVAPGWYVIRVTAVNGVFLESQPVTATILLWKP